jgi:hypothetical protein
VKPGYLYSQQKDFFLALLYETNCSCFATGKICKQKRKYYDSNINWQILNDKAILIHNEHGYSVSGMFTLEYRIQTRLHHAILFCPHKINSLHRYECKCPRIMWTFLQRCNTQVVK